MTFLLYRIGTTIQDVKKILENLDNQYILFKAKDYINISQQIAKPVFDNFLNMFAKNFIN